MKRLKFGDIGLPAGTQTYVWKKLEGGHLQPVTMKPGDEVDYDSIDRPEGYVERRQAVLIDYPDVAVVSDRSFKVDLDPEEASKT